MSIKDINNNGVKIGRSVIKGYSVVYGTSDDLLNFGEVLLTMFAAEKLGVDPIFFNYPKGEKWMKQEFQLFHPCYFSSKSASEMLSEAGINDDLMLMPLQEMGNSGSVNKLTMEDLVNYIKSFRQIQNFRVVNLIKEGNPVAVYYRSKDKLWKDYKNSTLGELLNNNEIKLSGTIIWFLYGYFLGKNSDKYIGIVPEKQKTDVMGAFNAGVELAGGDAMIYGTGEIDFMTKVQWEMWKEDKKWRKVPPSVIKTLLKDKQKIKEIKDILLSKKAYCPLVYNEKEKNFSFKTIGGVIDIK